jgi:hypothetical protein
MLSLTPFEEITIMTDKERAKKLFGNAIGSHGVDSYDYHYHRDEPFVFDREMEERGKTWPGVIEASEKLNQLIDECSWKRIPNKCIQDEILREMDSLTKYIDRAYYLA